MDTEQTTKSDRNLLNSNLKGGMKDVQIASEGQENLEMGAG